VNLAKRNAGQAKGRAEKLQNGASRQRAVIAKKTAI
jgi:hypothetical protein